MHSPTFTRWYGVDEPGKVRYVIIRESCPGDLRGIIGSCRSGRVISLYNSSSGTYCLLYTTRMAARCVFRLAGGPDTRRRRSERIGHALRLQSVVASNLKVDPIRMRRRAQSESLRGKGQGAATAYRT